MLKQLEHLGIDLAEVTQLLENEGVEKFIASWLRAAGGGRDGPHQAA